MKTLFTSEIKEGMVTASDTYTDKGFLVLPKDTIITKSIINKLVNNDVLMVEIAEEISANEDVAITTIADTSAVTNTPEYKQFVENYSKTVDNFKDKMNDVVNKSSPIDVDDLVSDTVRIVETSSSSLSIFSMLSTLKNYDDSTFNHSLNVALICNIMGQWLKLPKEDINLLTSCGLLHDVGKLLIPEEIICKPGKLSDSEYATIKTHSKLGYELLKNKNVDQHIQYAALMHHEKCDGTGYPLGLKGHQIDWCAKIVTIADIYEAMTAKRVYRGPLSPFTVISSFEQDGLQKYEPKYLLLFLENVVNSYVNCKVKLSNGTEGDIVYINKVNLSKPMIKTSDNFIDLSKDSSISIEQILE